MKHGMAGACESNLSRPFRLIEDPLHSVETERPGTGDPDIHSQPGAKVETCALAGIDSQYSIHKTG